MKLLIFVSYTVRQLLTLLNFLHYDVLPFSTEGNEIIMGNFNLPHNTRLTNFLEESSLIQIVSEPTQESGNILDLIITKYCEKVSILLVKELSFSDHK